MSSGCIINDCPKCGYPVFEDESAWKDDHAEHKKCPEWH